MHVLSVELIQRIHFSVLEYDTHTFLSILHCIHLREILFVSINSCFFLYTRFFFTVDVSSFLFHKCIHKQACLRSVLPVHSQFFAFFSNRRIYLCIHIHNKCKTFLFLKTQTFRSRNFVIFNTLHL